MTQIFLQMNGYVHCGMYIQYLGIFCFSRNKCLWYLHRHLFHSKNICPLLFGTGLQTNRHFGKILMYFLHLVKPSQIPTGTCFIQKIYAPSSSLLQGKHLPFTPSPLRLNIFRLFVILSLTQLYRYTLKIFLFSTATFKYKYRPPLRRIGQEYSAKVAFSICQSMKRIQSLPVRSKLIQKLKKKVF